MVKRYSFVVMMCTNKKVLYNTYMGHVRRNSTRYRLCSETEVWWVMWFKLDMLLEVLFDFL